MKKYFNALKYEILTDLIISKNYTFSFFMDIVIFMGILSFLILSNSGYKYTVYYSKDFDYRELVLISYIMWIISLSVIHTICTEIRLENIQGTLELKFMSIVPFQVLLLGKIFSALFIQVTQILTVLIITNNIFNVSIRLDLKILFFMILTYIGMYGFSLVISNVFTVSKISFFSYLIPLGMGNHLIHLSYIKNKIPNFKISLYIIVILCWLILGQYLFKNAINYVKEKGTLGLY